MSRSKPLKGKNPLRIHVLGSGFGESIAIEMPSGKWGIVDCCITKNSPGVLELLRKREVQKLAFFCLTHPHADHFTGAELLLNEYENRVERLWKYGGFSTKDCMTRLHLLSSVEYDNNSDLDASRSADKFEKAMNAIVKLRKSLSTDCYRHVEAPAELYSEGGITITAIRPNAALTEELQEKVMSKRAQDGCLIFLDESGHELNEISAVLELRFGEARVLLTSDAQGCSESPLMANFPTVLKAPHHGSDNGLWTDTLAPIEGDDRRMQITVITPYSRSGLPREDMTKRYGNGSSNLVVTGRGLVEQGTKHIPSLANCRRVNPIAEMISIEITDDGNARVIE